MSIFTQNFVLDQGADFAWTSSQYQINGNVQDLDGCFCRMQLRTQPNDQAPVLIVTSTPSGNGTVSPNGTTGTVTIYLTRQATASLVGDTLYQYDVFVDTPAGTSVRFVNGTIYLNAALTH